MSMSYEELALILDSLALIIAISALILDSQKED